MFGSYGRFAIDRAYAAAREKELAKKSKIAEALKTPAAAPPKKLPVGEVEKSGSSD